MLSGNQYNSQIQNNNSETGTRKGNGKTKQANAKAFRSESSNFDVKFPEREKLRYHFKEFDPGSG